MNFHFSPWIFAMPILFPSIAFPRRALFLQIDDPPRIFLPFLFLMNLIASQDELAKEHEDIGIILLEAIIKQKEEASYIHKIYLNNYLSFTNHKLNMIMLATNCGSHKLLQLMIDAFGNNFSEYNTDSSIGFTALDIACTQDDKKCIEVLLKNGFLEELFDYFYADKSRYDNISEWIFSSDDNLMLFYESIIGQDEDILSLSDSNDRSIKSSLLNYQANQEVHIILGDVDSYSDGI